MVMARQVELLHPPIHHSMRETRHTRVAKQCNHELISEEACQLMIEVEKWIVEKCKGLIEGKF